MARLESELDAATVAEPLITREEIVALLFNVADIAVSADAIEIWLKGGDDGEAEADES